MRRTRLRDAEIASQLGDHAGRNVTRDGPPHALGYRSGDSGLDARLDAAVARGAAVTFAGAMASVMALGWEPDVGDAVVGVQDGWHEPGSDDEQLAQMAEPLIFGEAEDWLQVAADKAVEVLDRRWGDVQALAVLLVERAAEHLDALLGRTLAQPCERLHYD